MTRVPSDRLSKRPADMETRGVGSFGRLLSGTPS